MNHPQSWDNCDKDVQQFVEGTVSIIKEHLSDYLVGVYLHGSLAMGSYYRPKSDIDIIAVVSQNIPTHLAKETTRALAHHSETRPTTGDLELSIITTYNAKSKPNPMPYELHYSHEWYEKVMGDEVEYSSNKTDLDINSHLAYVTTRGVKLFGKPINEAFGKPDWNSFQAAIIDDFNWIIDNEHILESPFYCTLNICRVLRYTQEPHHAFSKDEGGEWGLKHLPKNYHKLIQESLDVYHSPEVVDEKARRTGGKKWNEEELLAFRDFAREQSI